MPMTPEDDAKAKAWIKTRGGPCQCGSTTLKVEQEIQITSNYHTQSDSIDPTSGLAVIAVTCEQCARVTYYNVVEMGVVL